jgi:membrane protein required for colicin V production
MILVSLILGFILATIYHENLSIFLLQIFHDINLSILKIISFSIIFIIVTIVARILAKMLNKIVTFTFLQPINRIAGALFGLGKGLFIIGILFTLIDLVPFSDFLMEKAGIEHSILYVPIKSIIEKLYIIIMGIAPTGFNLEKNIMNSVGKADSTAKQLFK